MSKVLIILFFCVIYQIYANDVDEALKKIKNASDDVKKAEEKISSLIKKVENEGIKLEKEFEKSATDEMQTVSDRHNDVRSKAEGLKGETLKCVRKDEHKLTELSKVVNTISMCINSNTVGFSNSFSRGKLTQLGLISGRIASNQDRAKGCDKNRQCLESIRSFILAGATEIPYLISNVVQESIDHSQFVIDQGFKGKCDKTNEIRTKGAGIIAAMNACLK